MGHGFDDQGSKSNGAGVQENWWTDEDRARFEARADQLVDSTVKMFLGYYAAYLYKFKGAPAQGSGGTGWLLVSALLFLVIAMIHVAVNLVHSQPQKWAALAVDPWSIRSASE